MSTNELNHDDDEQTENNTDAEQEEQEEQESGYSGERHREIVDQAERVIEAIKRSSYDVASAEAQALRQLTAEAAGLNPDFDASGGDSSYDRVMDLHREEGLSLPEAADFHGVRELGFSQTAQARRRGKKQPSISDNLARAEEKLGHADEEDENVEEPETENDDGGDDSAGDSE